MGKHSADIIQLLHIFLGDSQNYQPRGGVVHLIAEAELSSSSGGSQHRGVDRFDCRL